jgi:dTDP-glucose pyrophosphorylase
MNIVIPAAGRGSRFKSVYSDLPKSLIPVNNTVMLIEAIRTLNIDGQYYIVIQRNSYSKMIIQALRETVPNCIVLTIDYYTSGSASTVMLCKKFINCSEELFVANCDQIMDWDSSLAVNELRKYDAGVVTIQSKDPKHSFVQLDEQGLAKKLVEKIPISDVALTGLHYWKNGKDFVNSAHSMIQNQEQENNEFYIAPTFNKLINQGKRIGVYPISQKEIHFVGTPADLINYENRKT